MARPDIVRGTYIDILIGNGAEPEVFTPICGLTTRTFREGVNTDDVFILDCADPEDIPVRRLNITGRQWDLSGEGLYNRSQAATIRAAMGVSQNYRFVVSEPAADGIDDGYYEGAAVLVNREIGGGGQGFATTSLEIASDGEWVWVPAA